MNPLVRALRLRSPLVLAPMVGVTTPALAAAVSNAGGLGSIGVGAVDADGARAMIRAVRAATDGAFNVNVFCHRPPARDPAREARWIDLLAPSFAAFGAAPPARLDPPYGTFVGDAAMLAVLVDERPPVVSFHFGLPAQAAIDALKRAGVVLFATATNLDEARRAAAHGVDAVVAQGYEAGGHRGTFDPDAPDDCLGTFALTRLLAARAGIPVIAAGGIMDGAGIAACLALGAAAAQLGTAFVGAPESSADAAHRAALFGEGAAHTVMTPFFSGRAARSLPNRFTALAADLGAPAAAVPAYPVAYHAAKALAAAASAGGTSGFAPQLAGQGAPLARALPAAELVAALDDERRSAEAAR